VVRRAVLRVLGAAVRAPGARPCGAGPVTSSPDWTPPDVTAVVRAAAGAARPDVPLTPAADRDPAPRVRLHGPEPLLRIVTA
jgi:hypothetical protein